MVFEDVNVVVCNALPFLTAPFHAELRHPFAIQLRVDRSAVEVGDCIESIDTGRCDFADTRGSRTRGLDWPQRVFAWRGLGRSSAVALGRIGVVEARTFPSLLVIEQFSLLVKSLLEACTDPLSDSGSVTIIDHGIGMFVCSLCTRCIRLDPGPSRGAARTEAESQQNHWSLTC